MASSFNILYTASYAFEVGYTPAAIEKLAKVLILKTSIDEIPIDLTLGTHVNNMIVKIGFMLMARDYINEISGKSAKSHIWVNYHLSNFIYNTKALLDATAIALNYFYKLGYHRGDIDFGKNKFASDVKAKAPILASVIDNQVQWVKDVIEWRDALIHRMSAPIVLTKLAKSAKLTTSWLKCQWNPFHHSIGKKSNR